jgi:pseudouridine kinase
MRLTELEQQIVALIRRDPLIGPAAIAERLGTTRSAVNVHLSNLGKKGVILGRGYILGDQPGVVVIGGANVDVKARSDQAATPATSNPGHGSMTPGGVGRNIAENLARLGTRTHLIATIGQDAMGDSLLAATSAAGVHVGHVRRGDRPTGTYTAVLDSNGELIVAVADMAATDSIGVEQINDARGLIASAELLVLDGNLSADTVNHAISVANSATVPVVLEPVSVPKATRIAPLIGADRPLFALTPNRDELHALTGLPVRTQTQVHAAARHLHARGVQHVWVRLGDRGSVFSTRDSKPTHLPAFAVTVEDVTGAGDAMLGAFCHAHLSGRSPVEAATYGHAAAALTITSPHTVRPDLTARLVEDALTLPANSKPTRSNR